MVLAAAVVALALAGVLWYRAETRPLEKRGSAREEFLPREPSPRRPPAPALPWPTYGFDAVRTHVARGFRLRPPFKRVWTIDAHDTLEFPPVVGHGIVYQPQQRGLFFALDARTGKVRWRKRTGRCSAASPALWRDLVIQSWMDFDPCPQDRPGATGYVVAWDARSGRRRWIFRAAPIESSPLVVRGTVYVGSWDHNVYALDARTGRLRWRFQTDEQVNTSAAYWRGTIYIATDGGSLYALDARTGRLRWRAQSQARFGTREFFYATPTVAYGRVYIGNTDGTLYTYGARSGRLLWARPLGSYIYAAAAVWRRLVFTGTYDGRFYALDAATGDIRWVREAPGAVHGAPTVMNGVVYYATCSSCGSAAKRTVKRGPDGTYALDARTGRLLWKFGAGKYANPVVSDGRRIYLVGRARLYALEPRAPRSRSARVRSASKAAAAQSPRVSGQTR
ncbi:PQQ-like beta-propeller repeat protein [Thermoleophilum album]|uniref:Outer membrane protein assembly factor BamB, contains PQQ-like beta-propeller repeat n=1 Tax=Thermoleophilum album TaxID=29539 RepID=A0A1H6FMC2_THEAL|nr:PQQ-like beta-propeller repeat protein [Thermoleophilum album]SEH10983.1 Outer membrane protein assembly factor BamB, contains PQQ-like beta-propeller repeat [Thermoleophilum album]